MALDKSIPCWLGTKHKPRRIDASVGQFDLALARVVRGAGGHITVAEAYRKLSRPRGRDHRQLTIENFLRVLRSVECIVIEFIDPEAPIVRLSAGNDSNIRAQVQPTNHRPQGKPVRKRFGSLAPGASSANTRPSDHADSHRAFFT
jgi:hypothetical protein